MSSLTNPGIDSRQTATLRNEIEEVVLGALRSVLARQQDTYPFIDTKLNIATGENFPDNDPIRGRNVIYSWIQGRGIEALAEHARWLLLGRNRCSPGERQQIANSVATLLEKVVQSMETARSYNHGRLPFMMEPNGKSLYALTEATSMSELFYAKGLMAAADFLHRRDWTAQAEQLFAEVIGDIRSGAFQLGQVAFDPKNPVQIIPGRFSHAGRMIALGGFPIFYRATGNPFYRDTGIEFIEYILAKHTAAEQNAPFQQADFWEFLDAEGAPWETPLGEVFSDPGHATEFVGLSLAHLRTASIDDPALKDRLLRVLQQNFANGFTGIGIVKSFDLKKRKTINSDMPWWSLPETMRAAALGLLSAKDKAQKATMEAILLECHHAFTLHYLRPEVGMMAIQCLNHDGSISAAIPATPDADPCYHTGLSLIGCLNALDEQRP